MPWQEPSRDPKRHALGLSPLNAWYTDFWELTLGIKIRWQTVNYEQHCTNIGVHLIKSRIAFPALSLIMHYLFYWEWGKWPMENDRPVNIVTDKRCVSRPWVVHNYIKVHQVRCDNQPAIKATSGLGIWNSGRLKVPDALATWLITIKLGQKLTLFVPTTKNFPKNLYLQPSSRKDWKKFLFFGKKRRINIKWRSR